MSFSKARPLVLVGAGKMGGAMLEGWIASGTDPDAVIVVDPSPSGEMTQFLADNRVRHETSPPGAVTAGVVLFAVKPQVMATIAPSLVSLADRDTLVVSVAAGTPVSLFEGIFGRIAIVRVMPNTPSQVGRGMSVGYANEKVSAAQRKAVDELLAAIGRSAWIDSEDQMDAVTAVSGSGPAYVFYLVEALALAGEKAGLSSELAMMLARQTVSGAGELLFQSPLPAAQLRQNVTSPNGTTAAALEVLMDPDGIQPVMDRAVAAAKRRSRELAG